MLISKRFLPPIPADGQLYEQQVEVAGVQHRKPDAIAFAKAREHALLLARDPENKHDPNAIMVIGLCKGLFLRKRLLLGYVPREIARRIVTTGFWGRLQPRLRNVYVSDTDYVTIEFDLVGPRGKRKEYTTV